MTLSAQFPLDFHRNQGGRFETFHVGRNAEAVQALSSLIDRPGPHSVYLWGATGSGKTHLLQAACAWVAGNDSNTVAYLPLREAHEYGPAICENLATCALVCIDDVDTIAGQLDWEQSLFALFNASRDRGHALVFSSRYSLKEIPLATPDLRSRLGWGLAYHLKALSDTETREFIERSCAARGLRVSAEVVEFIMRRAPRDVAGLGRIIGEIDRASLSMRRQVTIPLVKSVIEAVQYEQSRS